MKTIVNVLNNGPGGAFQVFKIPWKLVGVTTVVCAALALTTVNANADTGQANSPDQVSVTITADVSSTASPCSENITGNIIADIVDQNANTDKNKVDAQESVFNLALVTGVSIQNINTAAAQSHMIIDGNAANPANLSSNDTGGVATELVTAAVDYAHMGTNVAPNLRGELGGASLELATTC
jgi:hypothetical protein